MISLYFPVLSMMDVQYGNAMNDTKGAARPSLVSPECLYVRERCLYLLIEKINPILSFPRPNTFL